MSVFRYVLCVHGDLWRPAHGRHGRMCLAMCMLSQGSTQEPQPQPLSGGFSTDTPHSCAHTHTHTSVYLSMYMTVFTHKHIWTCFVLHASPGTQLPVAPLQAVPRCPGRSMCHQSVPDSPPSHAPIHTQAVSQQQPNMHAAESAGLIPYRQLATRLGTWQPWGWKEPAELLAVASMTAAPGSWQPSRTRDITWGDLG